MRAEATARSARPRPSTPRRSLHDAEQQQDEFQHEDKNNCQLEKLATRNGRLFNGKSIDVVERLEFRLDIGLSGSYLANDIVIATWNAALVYDTEAGGAAALEILNLVSANELVPYLPERRVDACHNAAAVVLREPLKLVAFDELLTDWHQSRPGAVVRAR